MDVLSIKTAIVAPTTHLTPKNGGNVGPVAPHVAQVSPNGLQGEPEAGAKGGDGEPNMHQLAQKVFHFEPTARGIGLPSMSRVLQIRVVFAVF